VVPLAGAVAVRLLADRVGLTSGLSTALARRGFTPGHDRGRVWVDVAVMLVAGGEAIADIDTLRHQSGLLGPVASPPTVWRTLDEATPAMLIRVENARARARRHVWGLLPALPPSKVAGADLGEVVVLDVDATLVTAHSEKEQAARRSRVALGFIRSGCGAITRPSCWRSPCGQGTLAPCDTRSHEMSGRTDWRFD
jgi:hypothetical protein